MKKILFCFLLIQIYTPMTAQHFSEEIEQQIDWLLKEMTIQEKLGQMNQLSADNMEVNYDLIRRGMAGSVLSITDPAVANKAQQIAMEESRMGIPIIIGRDVIHGFKTIFPIPLGQAASFDPDIVEEAARTAAVEASEVGIRWTFAPMVDITRDPRWGRVAESPGEDPFLASRMAVAMVKGFQGKDLSNPTSLAASAKHFAGYGAAEGGRDYNSTYIPERQMRNLYLKPFEAAVKEAGLATIMSAFHANDGIPATGDKHLLKSILRDEWGFDGFVVSDWASVDEMVVHGYSQNRSQAANQAIEAGIDMEMVSGTFVEHGEKLVRQGSLSMEDLNNAVSNILRVKFRLGLFENPYVEEDRDSKFYHTEHLALAKKAAEESFVLLKNQEETLPLKNIKTLAVFGPLSDAPHEQLGTWVFDGEKDHTITPLDALKTMYGEQVEILHHPGLKFSRDKDTTSFVKMRKLAAAADAIVVFLGEESILSGEAHSLSNLRLQGAQSKMLKELAALNKPLVSVFLAGRPLEIEKEVELSDAVIYAWHPGTMGGPAIADVLFGKSSPSGKLPMTFPKNVGQIPIYYSHENTGRPATDNEMLIDEIPVEASQTSLGNRSFYLDSGHEPLFPFGHGLTYTTFEYGRIELLEDVLQKDGILKVGVTLKNTGKAMATEVVQLYTRDLYASVIRPVKELKDFKRITLAPGEETVVHFELNIRSLAFWNRDMEEVVEPGEYELWLGGSSDTTEKVNFQVK